MSDPQVGDNPAPALNEKFEQSAINTGEVVLENCVISDTGIVIGEAYLVDAEVHIEEPNMAFGIDPVTMSSFTPELASQIKEQFIEKESKKFETALQRVRSYYTTKLDQAQNLPIETQEEAIELFQTDLMALGDGQSIATKPLEFIKTGMSAEYAVYNHFVERIEKFSKIEDPLFKSKAQDLKNMLIAFQNAFDKSRAKSLLEDAPNNSIPIATTFAPVQMTLFRKDSGVGVKMHGFLDCTGVVQSHTWVIARGSRVTAARIPEEQLRSINSGDMIIIDGPNKKVILNPAPATLRQYRELLKKQIGGDHQLLERSIHRTVEPDGSLRKFVRTANNDNIKISANIGFRDELEAAKIVNALTIGLYRTEFAFLARQNKDYHSENWEKTWEERWEKIFTHIARSSQGRAVSIRALDLEGDKIQHDARDLAEDPVKKEAMVRAQIRAALRVQASEKDANFSMMFPMINSPDQFATFKSWVQEEAKALDLPPLEVGAMLETMEVIPHIGELKAAYFSVGTNDLNAAAVGYDRYGEQANSRYDLSDPRFVTALEAIQKNNQMPSGGARSELSVCGDISSDPRYFALLIGLGYRHLSVGPGKVPMIKELARRIDTDAAKELVTKVKAATTRAEREHEIDHFNEKCLGLGRDGSLDMTRAPELPQSYMYGFPVDGPSGTDHT
jgi:phosphoenolpyruvate-protein phosphotransferase (PTS system enzyme I)